MARTTSDIVIDAKPASIMAVIADFPAYPAWATGMKSVEIIDSGTGGRAREVRFDLEAMPIHDTYTLVYTWRDDTQVTWKLSESGQMLRSMDGAYTLEPNHDGGTRVTYQLSVDVSIPLLGLLKRKAEKVVIDSALKGLKARVEEM